MSQNPDAEQVRDFYNRNAEIIRQRLLEKKPDGRARDIERAFWLFDKIDPIVVELGCGPGREARIIRKYTNNYLGVDISKEMIELARKEVPEAMFESMDLSEFQFPQGVDIVFAFASLLHCNQNVFFATLGKIYRALNKNGIFYMSLKRAKSGCERRTKSDNIGSTPVYLYSPDIIKIWGYRFKVIYEDYQDFYGEKWFTLILQK